MYQPPKFVPTSGYVSKRNLLCNRPQDWKWKPCAKMTNDTKRDTYPCKRTNQPTRNYLPYTDKVAPELVWKTESDLHMWMPQQCQPMYVLLYLCLLRYFYTPHQHDRNIKFSREAHRMVAQHQKDMLIHATGRPMSSRSGFCWLGFGEFPGLVAGGPLL